MHKTPRQTRYVLPGYVADPGSSYFCGELHQMDAGKTFRGEFVMADSNTKRWWYREVKR